MSSSYDSAIIDTAMIQHPDLVRLPAEVQLLYVRSIVWSRLHRTDGLIPRHMIPWFSPASRPADIDALVASGRCTAPDPDHIAVVDFLDNQMSAERVAQKRKDDQARYARWQDGQRVGKRVANTVSNGTDTTRSDLKRKRGVSAAAPSEGASAMAPKKLTDAQYDAMASDVFEAATNDAEWRAENGWRRELDADGYPHRSRKPYGRTKPTVRSVMVVD